MLLEMAASGTLSRDLTSVSSSVVPPSLLLQEGTRLASQLRQPEGKGPPGLTGVAQVHLPPA